MYPACTDILHALVSRRAVAAAKAEAGGCLCEEVSRVRRAAGETPTLPVHLHRPRDLSGTFFK